MSKQLSYSVVLLFLSAVLLVPFLGLIPVYQVSEAREGSVIWAIWRSGNFILPLRNGQFVPSKPILFHWLGYFLVSVIGRLDEFTLRLPSALSAIFCLQVVYWMACSLVSARAGLFVGLILLSSNGFLQLAADGRVDMLFTLFTTAAIAQFLVAYAKLRGSPGSNENLSTITLLSTAALCGFAVLTKGPLGIIAPLVVIGSISFFEEGKAAYRHFIRPAWVLSILIPLPWYVLATQTGSDAFISRFVFENYARLIGGEGITKKPFWFYIPHFLEHGAPWAVLMVGLLGNQILSRIKKRPNQKSFAEVLTADRELFSSRAAIIWCVSLLFFYSLSSGKRASYLLTLLPGVALFVGVYVCAILRQVESECFWKGTGRRLCITGSIVTAAMLIGITVIYALVVFNYSLYFLKSNELFRQLIGFNLLQLEASYWIIVPTACGIAAIVTFVRAQKRRDNGLLLIGWFFTLQVLYSGILTPMMVSKGATHTYRNFALKLQRLGIADNEITIVKTVRDESFDGLAFYLKKDYRICDPEKEIDLPGLYLARRKWFAAHVTNSSNPVEILSGGRMVDKPGDELVLFRLNFADPAKLDLQ